MTDTNTAEREAAEQWLRDRYGAYRGHFAWRELEEAFKAGRASLAASARSEPVAWQAEHQSGEWVNRETPTIPSTGIYTGRIRPLYTHPYPPEGMAGWKLVPIEPTDEMKAAAVKYANGTAVYKNVKSEVLRIEEGIYGEVYEAMIAAAPPLPASEAKEL